MKNPNPLHLWIGVIILSIVVAFATRSNEQSEETSSPEQVSPVSENQDESRSSAAETGPLRLVDVTADVGLDTYQHGAFRWGFHGDPVAMMGGGLCWIDYDQDGWLDLYVVNSYAVNEAGQWDREMGGLPRSTLFQNQQGQFVAVGDETGSDYPLRGNGCVAADFNLDGWPDLYITTARANLLLWNNGDGTFSEGAADAGVAAYGWQTAGVVGDLNKDGWPDLFLAGYVDINNRLESATMGFPNTHLGRRDLLFISQGLDDSGRVSFREVGIEAGIESTEPYEYGLGALLTDVDRDGDLDLFVANDTNPNRLYENQQMEADPEGIGFRFVEIGRTAAVDDTNSGMGVTGGDFDGNGRFDLFITNLGDQFHSVYKNDSVADEVNFEDAVGELGVDDIGVGWTGWGTGWADYDHDTDLDLIVVNGRVPVLDFAEDAMITQYFENLTAQGEPGQLAEATQAMGLEEAGPLVGRGSAAADYDNDGDLDIIMASIGGPLRLLENQGEKGNWLQIALTGTFPGAVVRAELADGQIIEREMHIGSSYLASEDPRCHIGLGEADKIEKLTVFWPDGRETSLSGVEANQLIWISP
ncbi:MAG: CRTAC1 family protein [Ardenticatenaceae bacterium]|nr:CRTAC1 family protein [Ardenticatenaceae bacterium]